jgi:hypothetical protein
MIMPSARRATPGGNRQQAEACRRFEGRIAHMRDPDLVVRAQQAATALESAWRRWRDMHGLGTDPLPAVSSYVGYSLDVPWGQARVVLGICAEDAERLATLLDRHDCVGPVHAAVMAMSVGRSPGNGLADMAGQPGAAGLVHVPAPAPASAGQQPLPTGPAFSRPDPQAVRSSRDPAAPSALTSPSVPNSADAGTPIAQAASRAVEASMASRKKAVNGSPAGHAGDAAVPDCAHDGDDRPDPSLQAAEILAGESRRPAAAEPAGLADAAAVTVVGAFPAMPPTQSFPWAADLTQGRSTRQPLGEPRQPPGEHSEEASAGLPEIVAFRPRPDLVSQPGIRQQDQASPASRDEAPTEPPEGDLARISRVMRGASFSSLKRQGTATERALTPASTSAPATERAPVSGSDADPAPADDQGQAESPRQQQGSRDRISAAANADAATWAASELPGQAAVTDTAV